MGYNWNFSKYWFGASTYFMDLEMEVTLRKAQDSDMGIVFNWRNKPIVYRGLYQQSRNNRPLSWEEHYDWWNTRPLHFRQFIIQLDDRSIGYINIQQMDYWSPEVAIVIGETSLWGQGIGKKALNLALDWLKTQGKEYSHTTILKNNTRSIRLFESVGFKRAGEAREDEWRYEKRLA